jgi:hypothetical protein
VVVLRYFSEEDLFHNQEEDLFHRILSVFLDNLEEAYYCPVEVVEGGLTASSPVENQEGRYYSQRHSRQYFLLFPRRLYMK